MNGHTFILKYVAIKFNTSYTHCIKLNVSCDTVKKRQFFCTNIIPKVVVVAGYL